MSTTSEELKKLYKKLGGDEENIRKASTPAEILNGINELDIGSAIMSDAKIEDLKDVEIVSPVKGETIEFDGEKWVNVDKPDMSVSKSVSGNPVEFNDGASAPLVKCVTEIQGSQDLHGYDKPWVGGAGKNKFPNSESGTKTSHSVSCVSDGIGIYAINGTESKGSVAFITFDLVTSVIPASGQKLYLGGTFIGTISFLNSGTRIDYWSKGSTDGRLINNISSFIGNSCNQLRIEIGANSVHTNETLYVLLISDSITDYSFEPYSNICPITAYTEGKIEVSDGDGNTTTHTTAYPSAIYRGSEDVVNGEVTSDMPVIDLGDLSWSAYTTDTTGHSFYVNVPTGVKSVSSDSSVANMVCENYETVAFINPSEWLRRNAIICQVPNAQRWIVRDKRYSDATAFTTAMNGVQLAYELATPTTSSVTPTNLPIKSISGYNHIESSTGDLDIDYINGAYDPLIQVMSKQVVANPTDAASETLTGLKVGDTTYSVPQGGGGSIQRMLMNNTITIE